MAIFITFLIMFGIVYAVDLHNQLRNMQESRERLRKYVEELEERLEKLEGTNSSKSTRD